MITVSSCLTLVHTSPQPPLIWTPKCTTFRGNHELLTVTLIQTLAKISNPCLMSKLWMPSLYVPGFLVPPHVCHPPAPCTHTPGECSSLQNSWFKIILFSWVYSILIYLIFHLIVCVHGYFVCYPVVLRFFKLTSKELDALNVVSSVLRDLPLPWRSPQGLPPH